MAVFQRFKYPYADPNLRVIDLFTALSYSNNRARERLEKYFSELTGKKHILITNSCRTALFLTWKTLESAGEVITSPLTCKVAIDPIVESGNKPVYADIIPGDLNINPDDVARKIGPKTSAIQVIHLGGNSCDMEKIMKLARENNLRVVEDCAQSLGAIFQGKNTGSFGDVSCFSLIKNAYSIGGGILATNDRTVYEKACVLNAGFSSTPHRLVFFRIIRNLLSSKQNFLPARWLYAILMRIKAGQRSYHCICSQLHKISALENKIAAHQTDRYTILHNKRIEAGKEYYCQLTQTGLLENRDFDPNCSSFTKFFVYNPGLESKEHLKELHTLGIEAMHLEHRHGSPYQERLVDIEESLRSGLINYDKVHDHLISLPLTEYMKTDQIREIAEHLVTLHRTL